MQNAAVAQMFEDIADLLEIAGENPFQIRAYRRASEAAATHPTPIEDLDVTQLRAIDGLGPATADKTLEFLATGRVAFLEKLREEYPRGLLELLRVPGLGPKKVQLLYKERGIASVETLNSALENGELKGLSGFGPKTLQNLESALRRLGEMSGELPLFDAVPLCNLVRQMLASSGAQIEIAGDARRGRETVASLEFVATGDEDALQKVAAAFKDLPMLQELQEESAQGISARLRPGIDAHLYLAAPTQFGSILFRATGSAEHLEQAAQRGWNDADFADEAALYAALNSPYIEPELREDEWEVRSNLVKASDIRGDMHAHSDWSDGSSSIRQMAAAAHAHGYEYHVISDHSKALAMANGLDAKRLREQAKAIVEVQSEFPDIKILRGIECDIMRDGTMDLDDEILGELDVVIASVHSAFNLPEAAQTERIIKAIAHPSVTFVAHPTGRIVGSRPAYEVNIAAIIEAAKSYGKALEINASYRLDLKAEHAEMAREAGVPLVINTDAHSTRMLPNIEWGILTARRAGLQSAEVLNTKPLAELMAWLKK
jgi:DNA polymerase (family 10)